MVESAVHLTLRMLRSIRLTNQKIEFYKLTNQKMLRSICSAKGCVPLNARNAREHHLSLFNI